MGTVTAQLPVFPALPKTPAHQLHTPGPEPPAAPGVVAWAGLGRGGAWVVERGCARARREDARLPAPGEGGGEEPTSAVGNSPTARRPSLQRPALGPSCRAPPPGSRTLDGRRRAIWSARIKGVGRCEPQTRGGREGGRSPEAVWGTGGPAGRGLSGGLTDGGSLRLGRAEQSGAMASGKCARRRGRIRDWGEGAGPGSCCSVSGARF